MGIRQSRGKVSKAGIGYKCSKKWNIERILDTCGLCVGRLLRVQAWELNGEEVYRRIETRYEDIYLDEEYSEEHLEGKKKWLGDWSVVPGLEMQALILRLERSTRIVLDEI